MGYDFYMVEDPTPAEQAAVDQAEAAFDQAVAERDKEFPEWVATPERAQSAAQEKVHAAHVALNAARTDYYRLNISGMSAARRVMAELEMVKPGQAPWPDAPWERPDAVLDEATFQTIREYRSTGSEFHVEFDPAHVKAYDDYEAEVEAALRRHDGDTPGIAIHKFGSNDGWVVTPGECRAAVELWQRASTAEQDAALRLVNDRMEDPSEVRAWFEDWVAWLALASKRGGFRVW